MFKAERLSNIELLRIVAMFLVLVVHSDFFSLSAPTSMEIANSPKQSYIRIFIESFSIVCVNVFVMISGWFGIRPRLKNVSSFLYQCIFFLFGIYFLSILLGKESFSKDGLSYCFLLQPWNWFIKAYLFLLILSPVLNLFIAGVKKKTAIVVIFFFFLFQSVYGWYFDSVNWFAGGYSTISFIGLYILMQYKRKYMNLKKLSSIVYFSSFLSTAILLTVLFVVFEGKRDIVFMYNNPLVIFSSYCFFMTFERMKIKNKIVNLIASSSFAVFLLHTNPFVCKQYFVPFIQRLYSDYSGIECLGYIFIFLIVVFVFSVFIDQFRKFSFNKVILPILSLYDKNPQ